VLADALQAGWQVPPDDALLLARLAGGRLGWAVDQFHHPERREERSQDLAALWSLVEAGRLERLRFAGQLATQRDPLRLFGLLEIWSSWWRDVLLAQAQCTDACSNVDQLPRGDPPAGGGCAAPYGESPAGARCVVGQIASASPFWLRWARQTCREDPADSRRGRKQGRCQLLSE
jgi:hypothetical protein